MDDYRCEGPLDPKKGMGFEYEYNGETYVGEEVTIPAPVYVDVSSFIGVSPDAEHYYCRLWTPRLGAKRKGHEHERGSSWTPNSPEELNGYNIHITRVADKTLHKRGMFMGTEMSIKKGERTDRFDCKEHLKKRTEEELKRLFPKDKGWSWDLLAFEDE